MTICRVLCQSFALILLTGSLTLCRAQDHYVIVLSAKAEPPEKVAAQDLKEHLGRLYPAISFEIGSSASSAIPIFLGTSSDLTNDLLELTQIKASGEDSYVIRVLDNQTKAVVIAGANARATIFGVSALLQRLGFGFYLSYNTAPISSTATVLDLSTWQLADSPLVQTRTIFEWHNFLSGCSTWNLPEWEDWITSASRLRFNTVIVHAYGNNPMFSFTYNGLRKPTGYLASTNKGRDWGTEHVEDVRNLVGAEGIFDKEVFGADASEVEDSQTFNSATHLMQQVFAFARSRGMNVTFALDVDSESANPQQLINTLPPSARINVHGTQIADQDTPEGYAYYKNQITQLLQQYPQITTVAIWFRGNELTTPWRSLREQDLTSAWRTQYLAMVAGDAALQKDVQAPGLFALGRMAAAFRRALDENGHSSVELAAGSWRFQFLAAANAFMPKNVTLIPLDYNNELFSDPAQEVIRRVGRERQVEPVIWAQHDDREFAGRPRMPPAGLASSLNWSNSHGFGVIHWTTRPLDLYVKNIADQVWQGSRDQTLQDTASALALNTFGAKAQSAGSSYLMDWIQDAPAFGRDTTDVFLDQTIDASHAEEGYARRSTTLAGMRHLLERTDQINWLSYYEDWEKYAQSVYIAQDALQKSRAATDMGDISSAQHYIHLADPESAIRWFAETAKQQGVTAGDKGLLVSLNLRWLPYFIAQQQAVGLSAIHYMFSPTTNENLAQQPGQYTFAFDPEHHITQILGSLELGAPVDQQANLPTCRGGLSVHTSLPLKLTAFVGTRLRAGIYEVTFHASAGLEVSADGRGNWQNARTPLRFQTSGGTLRLALATEGTDAFVCDVTLRRLN